MHKRASKVSIERHPLAEAKTGYFLVSSEESDGRVATVATGFCAVPQHYFGLARGLAEQGYDVVIPDITKPLPGEDPTQTVAYKCNRIRMALEDLGSQRTIDEFRALGHSFGGAVQAGLIHDSPFELVAIDFINSIGISKLDESAINILWEMVGIYFHEGLEVARHPSHFIGANALRAEIAVVTDVTNRRHELHEIRQIDALLQPFILAAAKKGIKTRFFISPKDHVVDPRPTIEAIGRDAVIIHKNANHYAVNAHGPHVAKLIAA